jgi:uridine phosphorylase
MVKFGKHRPVILFLVAFAAVSVSSVPKAIAASVGFYASTFDPPTRSQIRMIHCALGDDPLHKECGEIGKGISRVVVLVIEDSEKDTFASTREQILMLKRALQKHSDRVEIVASTKAEAEQRKRALLEDKNLERLFQLVSADAYKHLKLSPGGQDPKLAWLVFPLEEEGGSSRASAEGDQLDFDEVVEKLGLYSDVSPDLATLQRSLFEEGWNEFLEDLKSACPININEKACAELAPRWDAVAIVAADDSKKEPVRKEASTPIQLVYKQSQSEDRWAEKFVKTALQFVQRPEEYNKFKPVADDIAARVYQGYPYGKLPHLRRFSIKKNTSAREPFRVVQKPVACSTPQGSYSADMDQYLADRFPRAFAVFLKEGARRRSSLPIDLYVHNHPVGEAYEFHRRDGYTTFYFLQTRRGQLHRDIYLAVKSHPLAYRVVLTSVRGNDRQANVLCQIQRTHVFSNYRLVESRQAQRLFVFNSLGASLRLNREDWLLLGFKGNWSRLLVAQDWRQYSLVKEGLDIDLFTHPMTKQKIVVARNAYGDDTDIVLKSFYKKGLRQILYLGAAGAVANYRVGDVVIPNEFTDRHYNSVRLKENFAAAYQSELAPFVTVYSGKRQGWVQSLFDETKDVLLDWRKNAVVSVDIEGLYLARFAKAHSDLRIAALFVISDETLGDITIEETNAVRKRIDQSVDKLLAVLFSKVSRTTQ